MSSFIQTIKSETYPYRIPVFRVEPATVAYRAMTETATKIRLRSIDFASSYLNVSYNNNVLRWIRKVEIASSSNIAELFPIYKDVTPYNVNFPAENPVNEWHLCSLFIPPGLYESVDSVVTELNFILTKSINSLFDLTETRLLNYTYNILTYRISLLIGGSLKYVAAYLDNCKLTDCLFSNGAFHCNSLSILLSTGTQITFSDVSVEFESMNISSATNTTYYRPTTQYINYYKRDDNLILNSSTIVYSENENKNNLFSGYIVNANVYGLKIYHGDTGLQTVQYSSGIILNSEIITYTDILSMTSNIQALGSLVFVSNVGNIGTFQLTGSLRVYQDRFSSSVPHLYNYWIEYFNVPDTATYISEITITFTTDMTEIFSTITSSKILSCSNMETDATFNSMTSLTITATTGIVSVYFEYNNMSTTLTGTISITGALNIFPASCQILGGTLKSGLLEHYYEDSTVTASLPNITDHITTDSTSSTDNITGYNMSEANKFMLFDTYYDDIITKLMNGEDIITGNIFNSSSVANLELTFPHAIIPVTSETIKAYYDTNFLEVAESLNIDDYTTVKKTNITQYRNEKYIVNPTTSEKIDYTVENTMVDDFYYNFLVDTSDLWNVLGFNACTYMRGKSVFPTFETFLDIDKPNIVITDPIYIIKGKYYSEQLYYGPVHPPNDIKIRYSVSGGSGNVSFMKEVSLTTYDDIKSFSSDILAVYLNSVHKATLIPNLSITKLIELKITQNADIEHVLNSEELYQTQQQNIGSLSTVYQNEPTYSNIQQNFNINKVIEVPKNGTLYVYLTGTNQRYPFVNNNALLHVEYIT